MSVNTILQLPQVKARTGLSRSTIYSRIAQGSFPKPAPLGGATAVGWLEAHVESWIQSRLPPRGSSPRGVNRVHIWPLLLWGQ
jgi:prophage regulatory protein